MFFLFHAAMILYNLKVWFRQLIKRHKEVPAANLWFKDHSNLFKPAGNLIERVAGVQYFQPWSLIFEKSHEPYQRSHLNRHLAPKRTGAACCAVVNRKWWCHSPLRGKLLGFVMKEAPAKWTRHSLAGGVLCINPVTIDSDVIAPSP